MNRSASNPIRVALFHPSLIHGGIQRVFVNLARGFLEHGLAVDMVQAAPEGNFRDQVPAGVRLVDLNASRALTSLVPLVRYLRRERPDVIISGAIQTNVVAVWAKLLSRISTRLILTEHNAVSASTMLGAHTFRTRAMPFFVRRFYPWADHLVAVSRGAADDLAAVLGIPADRVRVIYNPIVGPELWRRAAEELDHPWFGPGNPPVVLAVGRLHYQKDYPTLIRAFHKVRSCLKVRLMLLGDGEERGTLEKLSFDLGLTEHVMFAGNVSNPLPFMRRAAVLVMSSIFEALPTVLIEALAVNTPIVAADCQVGPREILCDGKYGSLVPVGDTAGLAGALIRVLQSQNRPVVPKEALERFQHDRVICQYLKLMDVTASMSNAAADFPDGVVLTRH